MLSRKSEKISCYFFAETAARGSAKLQEWSKHVTVRYGRFLWREYRGIYLLNTTYCTIGKTVSDSSTITFAAPYKVKVTISELNIRTGPGTNYAKTGKFTGVGTFTIVEESGGTGSDKGWGKLKSGAGWISLAYCTKV